MIWADTSWRDALDDPGASQMQHTRALFEKFPFHKLRPNSGFVVDGPQSGGAKVRGILANDGTFGFVYTPRGEPFTVNMGLFSGVRVKTSWFDPRDGSFRELYTGDNVAFPNLHITEHRSWKRLGAGTRFILGLKRVVADFTAPTNPPAIPRAGG